MKFLLIVLIALTSLFSQETNFGGGIEENLPPEPQAELAPVVIPPPQEYLGNNDTYPIYDLKIKVVVKSTQEYLYPNEGLRFRVTIHNLDPENSYRFIRTGNIFDQLYFHIKDSQGNTLNRSLNFSHFLLENNWDYEKVQEEIIGSDVKEPNLQSREVEILPYENFSFLIQLNDFYEFKSPGRYFVQGYFYPHGVRNEIQVKTDTTIKKKIKISLNF